MGSGSTRKRISRSAPQYDRNSNITLIEDQVHTGFDVEYTMDDLDRLIDAEEGTWSGSAITTRTRHQVWTLGHTGNWDVGKLDLDGDDNWNETDEYNDDRTHNAVNELTARDTDDNGTNDYSLTYDAVGNLTDDDEEYEYVYDPFGRLREVKNQSSALVAEYTYNGLGFMLGVHEDTDDDGDVDGSDLWFYTAYDEAWRGVSTYRSSDSDPKEEFVVQLAGDDGRGGASYINGVVLRNKDANTAWTTASDGTLEERVYYCQNWRGDVSALVHSNRVLMEWVKYSAYGVPIGLPGADTDSDGDCDSTDITQIQTWIDTPPSPHEVRGDVDLDGDVDAGDKSTAQVYLEGTTSGWDALTAVGNKKGSGGYESAAAGWLARNRCKSSHLGRWLRRDPLGVGDGMNLLQYVRGRAIVFVDPFGLASQAGQGGQSAPLTCPGTFVLIGTGSTTITYTETAGVFVGMSTPHLPLKFEESAKAACCKELRGLVKGNSGNPQCTPPCEASVGVSFGQCTAALLGTPHFVEPWWSVIQPGPVTGAYYWEVDVLCSVTAITTVECIF